MADAGVTWAQASEPTIKARQYRVMDRQVQNIGVVLLVFL